MTCERCGNEITGIAAFVAGIGYLCDECDTADARKHNTSSGEAGCYAAYATARRYLEGVKKQHYDQIEDENYTTPDDVLLEHIDHLEYAIVLLCEAEEAA